MATNQLAGRNDGDQVYLAFPATEVLANGSAKVTGHVHRAVVFSAEHGLVRLDESSTPRGVYNSTETVHPTAAAAWRHIAGVVRAAGVAILSRAAEFDAVAAEQEAA